MDTTYWSRRRVLTALAATGAVAATSSLVLSPVSAAAVPAAAAADGGTGDDPFALPDTDRAKAVKAWMTGGKATRAAA
ncbi:twin-arginine translocation signal domain-containing protein, partial [Streptomyces chrestomyceticus]